MMHILGDWKQQEDGRLLVGPVLGWDLKQANDATLLRVIYAYSQDEVESGGRVIQVALSAKQVRQLAEDFVKLARNVDEEEHALRTSN